MTAFHDKLEMTRVVWRMMPQNGELSSHVSWVGSGYSPLRPNLCTRRVCTGNVRFFDSNLAAPRPRCLHRRTDEHPLRTTA